MKAKTTLFSLLAIITMMFSMVGMNAGNAWSADLQQAKAAGQIGEQPNGYLGIVGSAPGDVQALVSSINNQRRAAYQNIAQSNGTSLQAVEVLAGRKAIEKTPSGQYIQSPSGQWIRK
ncbi:MAG: DUF1318 domain-containing protein [Zetaproteobacteria bacterium CG_4_9_14_3_um_filter_53_7]|nr:MAG: DUF1318 domain-containing protein [Zetaproteobacteria bacterium CG_4_9_14_3_um_filter_53_7]